MDVCLVMDGIENNVIGVNLFVNILINKSFLPLLLLYLPVILQGGEEERVCPVIMCTRAYPDPECQLFPGEVEEPEEEVADEGRERESDRDSAVESTQGSDTSDGLIRPGDKEDALGDLFFPGEK